MNIVDLFPKRKRVVGYNTTTGMRTAYALKQTGVWQEMMADIAGCTTTFQLLKCGLVWSNKATADKWPEEWVKLASEEFDKAVEALAAQQAE